MSRAVRSLAPGLGLLSIVLAGCGSGSGGGPSGPGPSVVVEGERLEALPGSPPMCVVRFTVFNPQHFRVEVGMTWQAHDAQGAGLGEAFTVMQLEGGERKTDRSTNFLKDWDPHQSPQCDRIGRFERTSTTAFRPPR